MLCAPRQRGASEPCMNETWTFVQPSVWQPCLIEDQPGKQILLTLLTGRLSPGADNPCYPIWRCGLRRQ